MRTRLSLLALLLALSACTAVFPTATPPRPPAKPGGDGAPVAGGGGGGKTQIVLGTATAGPGQTTKVTASLRSGGARIAGTQNDIEFDPRQVSIARKANGKPDCAGNSAIGKEGTAFSFQPPGCSGTACTGIRALVLSLSSVDPIPDGSALYTCTVQVAAAASPGPQTLRLTRVGFSDPAGKAINGGGSNGTVTIAR